MQTPLLTLEIQQAAAGTVVIFCSGEVDLSVSGELEEAIEWSYTPDLKRLRIDATNVSFMDSTGLDCLARAQTRCDQLGVTLEFVPSPAVRRVFEATGFGDVAVLIEHRPTTKSAGEQATTPETVAAAGSPE